MSTALKRLHMALMLAYPAASVGGAIDGNTTNLWGAYALHKLVGAYGGSCIRVRESGGDTEANIGFTFDGSLNVSALLAHCGANSGYVVTWYDQSGAGNDLAHATAANQPMIVDTGAYCGELLFDGTNDSLETSAASGTPAAFTVYLAGRNRTVDNAIRALIRANRTSTPLALVYTQRFSPTHADDFISTMEMTSGATDFYDNCLTSDEAVHTFRFDRSQAQASENGMFVDGVAQTSISNGGANAGTNFSAGGWCIGANNATNFARMSAKALLLYEAAHATPATIAALITPTAPTLGLDSYTTNLWGLYSLRKQITAYAGSCVRIRESGGNTETDIGFDADGFFDEAAALSHCGANSGFIVTWYDQSGNGRNFAQATTANQPRIVNSGVVDADGITFDGSNDHMATSASSGTVPAFTVYVKGNLNGTGSQYAVEHSTNSDTNNAFALLYASRLLKVVVNQIGSAGSAVQNYQANFVGNVLCGIGDRSQGTKAAMATLHNGGVSQTAASASGSGVVPSGNYAAHPWHIGARSGGTSPMNGDMHTVVIYEAAHATATVERISRAIG